jgi:hypothetical protein
VWLHADNARPHTAKVSTDYVTRNRMKRAPHPPDSPDLASSDFFLFGYVKRKLMGYRAESESELLVGIGVILAEIPRDILNAVFSSGWTDCKNASTPMERTSGELKRHQSGKPFLFGRFIVPTLGVGDPRLASPSNFRELSHKRKHSLHPLCRNDLLLAPMSRHGSPRLYPGDRTIAVAEPPSHHRGPAADQAVTRAHSRQPPSVSHPGTSTADAGNGVRNAIVHGHLPGLIRAPGSFRQSN